MPPLWPRPAGRAGRQRAVDNDGGCFGGLSDDGAHDRSRARPRPVAAPSGAMPASSSASCSSSASVAGVWFVVVGGPADGAGRSPRRARSCRARPITARRSRGRRGRARPDRRRLPHARGARPTGWSRRGRSPRASWCRRRGRRRRAAPHDERRGAQRRRCARLRSRPARVVEVWAAPLLERGELRRAAHPGRRRHGRLGHARRLDDGRRRGGARAGHPPSGCRRHARRDGGRIGALGRARRRGPAP